MMTNKEGVVDSSGRNATDTIEIHVESDGNASFLRAARSGNVEKVVEYLKGSIDINTSNANGLNALHLSSKEGHVSVVIELVKRGANVNAATKKGNTALHIASLAGQEEVVKFLVRNGANVNVQSQNGFTPLYMAAQENHDAVVKFLLANGASQSLATEDGFTPLAVALQQGHDKVVAVLLENDAKGRVRLPALHIAAKKDDCKAAALLLQSDHDPDVTSKSGFTPLHIAAHYGNEKIGALLLDKNADVNYSAKHQITPLHVAAKWGKSNMVTLLVDKCGKIDASTRDGLTPLHCAARSGHEQVVDLLLERGAPITAKTKNGLAPLHMASQGDHVDCARILLYHKAPVDDVTVDYLTALHVAAHCGHVRVAKLLLDRKADANSRALNGFTPLHIACKKNRIKVVELLLKHGASIEATTESGLTPLHVASFMGSMNIVIYLIQHGANPDVPTVRGETPLHLAARANQSDIIRILLRNGAHVDASAREHQTPLHIAARLGNVDIVGLLLQHGAAVDATTKDMYTALHIAAKEGQEEVASVLLDHGASLTATTKKGFTPLHLAAKYGNIKVARLLLQKDAPVDSQGKNGVTPLHVAAHYDHVDVALLLLDKGAYPHATAKNGYTPLHIAAKKNQMDIATTLLEYGAKSNAESKAGFTPLHLAAQEGHTDMTTLLLEHHADPGAKAKNMLTPLHLCSQEDCVNVAAILVKNGADISPHTKAGYTPLHVACHFGQINMIRFLLQHGADVNAITSHGYTPLHQAAQQGHTLIINLLLEHKASPNTTTSLGQTALSIAQRLGYVSVVETLKIVTETTVTTTTTTVTEEKYTVVAPETMQETFMSDSEDEGDEDTMLGDQSFRYLTADEMKSLGDDSLPIDVTRDEKMDSMLSAPLTAEEDHLTPQHIIHQETFSSSMTTDNIELARAPVHAGFLVSFMVDARGGAMRGCRHSGVRVIIPPRKAPMPMRITCRYLRKEKLSHPPPLMEGEACASRILEVGPSGAKFLGPVIIEVPHFAAMRGREREITIMRSDNGETWREHTPEASDDAIHDVFNESFEGEELTALDDLNTSRITRILTTDFPQYFAIITRIRQEVHGIGPEGGMVSSTVVPQVQAIFPEGALTKKIKVGLQAHPLTPELVTKMLGNRVAVSPIVTVEPRRRKFHKPITLTIPVPQAATKGMINQYSGDAPTLRLLCSITGGSTKAQWEDVTGSTPLTFVNDCVSFTTTVSARFWLMDCRQVTEATKFATELYREAIHVPFMAKFVVFAKRHDPLEAQLRVFCMTDDKEDKTLESQEHFSEVAKSRDVEVLEAKYQFLEFAGNLVPVTKSGEQLSLTFQAFRENRLPFIIRVKDPHQEPLGRVAFMREARVGRGEPPQTPICNLNIVLPDAQLTPVSELVTLEKKYGFVEETGLANPELIHRADLRLSDIAKELRSDWIPLALQLDVPESDINSIKAECSDNVNQQAIVMLRHWLQRAGTKATGNSLEKALKKINRDDIVNQCMFNVELVTDDVEKAVAKVRLDQSGFDTFKEELGSSRDASLRRDASLDGTLDDRDIMKEAESAAETSSESSDKEGHFKTELLEQHTTQEGEDQDSRDEEFFVREAVRTPESTLVEQTLQKTETMTESFTHEVRNGHVFESVIQEEEKSEPTTATISSEATAELEISSSEEKPMHETHTQKEWTETDESGNVKHIKIKTETSIKVGAGGQEIDVGDDDLLTFVEKRNFFQRLSLTSDTLPTTAKWTQEVSLDDIPMAQGEIIKEQISFEDRLKMFEPDEDNVRRKLEKNGKPDQQTVYRYDFTKSGKERVPTPEFRTSELDKAEDIVRQVTDKITAEEKTVTDDIGEKDNAVESVPATLETVEKEVSTLLAEVKDEEVKASSTFVREDSNDMKDSYVTSVRIASTVSTDESPDFAQLEGMSQSNGYDIETPPSETVDLLQDFSKSDPGTEEVMTIHECTSRQESVASEHQAKFIVEEYGDDGSHIKASVTREAHEEQMESHSANDESASAESSRATEFMQRQEPAVHGAKHYGREGFREALELEDDKIGTEEISKPRIPPKELLLKCADISAVVKSQILEEEIGQSIEESPLEIKYIAEDIEKCTDIHYEGDVYKHIKTEIFSQQLGEVIESGSPERKDISPVSTEPRILSMNLDEAKEVIDSDEDSLRESEGIITPPATEDISQHSITENIEGDDLEEYEEAKAEHSLSEQLLALASNASQPVKYLEDEFAEHQPFDSQVRQGFQRGSRIDEIGRKSKNGVFSRSDKKEARSLKTTKQVSTIEEHSSIESSDSPLELFHPDLSEEFSGKHAFEKDTSTETAVQESSHLHCSEGSKSQLEDNVASNVPSLSIGDTDKASSPDEEPSSSGKDISKPGTSKLPSSPSDDKSSKDSKKSDSDSEGKKPPGCNELVVAARKDESFSSSGEMESHYYSAETSDSGKSTRSTPRGSRPCSSEFEVNVLSGQCSEYETCATSQETTGEISGSYATAATSQETSYSTACSSLSRSSRESAYSVDSESSGNLASIEASSEASETLVPSAQEMELDFGAESEMPVLDEEPSSTTGVKEPYDMDIPESIIRSGIEMPFMKNWEMPPDQAALPGQWGWHFATEQEITHTFEEMRMLEGGDTTPLVESSTISEMFQPPPDSSCSYSEFTVPHPSAHFSAQTSEKHSEDKHDDDDKKGECKAHLPFHAETRGTKRSTESSHGTDDIAEQIGMSNDEEQHSVSESSATHSEHTWHTSSVDTAVHISGHLSSSCIIPEAQNAISITDSLSDIPPEMGSSLEQMLVQAEPSPSYLQLNGPVEVDYNPEYDGSDGDGSDHPDNPPDELQFELEDEVLHHGHNALNGDANGQQDNEDDQETMESSSFADNCAALLSQGFQQGMEASSSEPQSLQVLAEAEQPESQQEQQLDYREYEENLRSEGLGFHYQSSHLPESDQCNLQSETSEVLLSEYPNLLQPEAPEANAASSVEVLDREPESSNIQRSDSADKVEIVDTSPEDERYDCMSQRGPTSFSLGFDASEPAIDDDFAAKHNSHSLGERICPELYTHDEELELKEADMFSSSYPDDDKQSTPSFEMLPSRRFYPRSAETSAASSLQEFERLEADIAAGKGSHSSVDSYEKPSRIPDAGDNIRRLALHSGESSVASSLQEFERLEAEIAAGRCSRASADSSERAPLSRSAEDEVLLTLTDLEKLERDCVESDQIDKSCAPILSEIDEGPESQASEGQDKQAVSHDDDDKSDESEYEKRMTEMEEVIRMAETNVEKFHEEAVDELSEAPTCEEFTVSHNTDESPSHKENKGSELAYETELIENMAKCETSMTYDRDEYIIDVTEGDADACSGHDSGSNSSKNGKGDCMISSTDSVDPSSSTATHATYQFDTDSVMSSSINSAQASGGEECTMVSSTDTLEPESKLTYSQGDIVSEDGSSGGIVHDSNGIHVSLIECRSGRKKRTHDPQHMEMFLTKLTDDSDETEEHIPPGLLQSELSTCADFSDPTELCDPNTSISGVTESVEWPSGVIMPDDDESGNEEGVRTTTSTTRIVTTVTTDGTEGETSEELRSSMEAVLSQFMSDEPATQDSSTSQPQ